MNALKAATTEGKTVNPPSLNYDLCKDIIKLLNKGLPNYNSDEYLQAAMAASILEELKTEYLISDLNTIKKIKESGHATDAQVTDFLRTR